MLTGLNDAFIIGEDERSEILNNCRTLEERERTDEIIRPILRGRDIKKSGHNWAGLYIIAAHNGYTSTDNKVVPRIVVEELPSLKKWFDSGNWNNDPNKDNYDRLKNRTDKGDTPYNLRDCAYMDDFLQQKIIFSRISGNQPCFALDRNGMLLNDTGYLIIGNNLEYLLSELVSDVTWFAFKRFYMGGGIEKEFKVNNLLNLPIRQPGISYEFTDEETKFISSSVK